jgi:hypothetical protein
MKPSVEAPVALYDESHNLRPRNAFEAHLLRPFKRGIDNVRQRIRALTQRANDPVFLDQYPARTVPYVFSKLYTFDMVAPRRVEAGQGGTGYWLSAPVVDLGQFILPRNGNIVVGRDGPFYWCQSNVAGYMSFTYDSPPGIGDAGVVARPVSDIFDSVIDANGGALQTSYFYGAFHNINPLLPGANGGDMPRICFDVELYDRKRGKRLHEERLPPQLFSGGNFANKDKSHVTRFDPNTEIEPRVRLLDVCPGTSLVADDTFGNQQYAAAQFRGYLNIIFKGYKVLEV